MSLNKTSLYYLNEDFYKIGKVAFSIIWHFVGVFWKRYFQSPILSILRLEKFINLGETNAVKGNSDLWTREKEGDA